MELRLIAVGRLKKGPLQELCDDYLTRMSPRMTVREVEERRPLDGAELKRREGELILRETPDGAFMVALDAGGREMTSENLAGSLDDWAARGRGITFVIGGADGLDDAVLDRADFTLAMGRMTWPHMIARLLLLEQVYRAQSIARGHPYHRG